VNTGDTGLRSVLAGHGDRHLVVTTASSELRRQLGPVAWSTLEVLVLVAERTAAGQLVARLGVRGVAAELGVGKDAAGRALTALRERGLIAVEERRERAGRFDGVRYVISVPVSVEPDDTPRTKTRRALRHHEAPTLFDNPNGHPNTRDYHDSNNRYSGYYDSDDHNSDTDSSSSTDLPNHAHALALGMLGADEASEPC